MALRPITVSQLNKLIASVLKNEPLLGNITVVGEISNLKNHSSGHKYFSISDGISKINCFFPASYAEKLNYELGNGLEVVINGYINVYEKGGYYSLFVRSITVSGEGNLSMAFQLMKDKLEAEGLFDPAHKRPIPTFPKKVGVVTSGTGAAVEDIKKIITQRTSLVDITIFPVPVQGEGAAGEIAAMLDYINANFFDIDTLIVGRGGGSQEDLWAFNEEVLARAIYRSRIPVISAVGHEIDFSISDFVADARAETPTAAAEMAVPDMAELMKKLERFKGSLLSDLKQKLNYDELRVEMLMKNISIELADILSELEHNAERCKLILEENNPAKVLGKGYSIIESDGKLVKSAANIKENTEYKLRFADGEVTIVTKEVKHGV